jgi:hypothetical protein
MEEEKGERKLEKEGKRALWEMGKNVVKNELK